MAASGDGQLSFSRKQQANGVESKRSKPKLSPESMGYPVKRNKPPPRDPSFELEGFNDPLEGHPHYQLIRPLNPGSSGSVYLCIDLRSNVRLSVTSPIVKSQSVPPSAGMECLPAERGLTAQRSVYAAGRGCRQDGVPRSVKCKGG